MCRSFWSEAGQTSVAFVVGAVGTIAGTVLSYVVLRPWLGVEGYKARNRCLFEDST